jgi:hypothetical protein
MAGDLAKAKGTVLVSVVKFLRSRRQEAAALLPAHCQRYLEERVLDSSWYPEADLVELIRVVASMFPGNQEQALYLTGRAALAAFLRDRKYRELHHVDVLADMPRRVVALWSTQHDTGQLRMQLSSDTSGTVTLTGFGHPSREMCSILTGYIAEMLSEDGIVDPAVTKAACIVSGTGQCTWNWRSDGRNTLAPRPDPAKSC